MSQTETSSNTTLKTAIPQDIMTLLGLCETECTTASKAVVINSVEDMGHIADAWQKLSLTSREPLAHFQSFDWCMNWVNHCHDPANEELSIIPIWKNGELVCLLPLMITTEKAGVRVMRFLGEPLIEYSNVLINKDKIKPQEVVKVWKKVRDTLNVDAFIFQNFPSCSSLFDIFGAHTISRSPSQASSIMDLTRLESWEAFRAGMSRSARRSRNKRRNKLAKMGEIGYRVYEGGTSEYRDIVERSVIMKQEWLEETGRRVGDLFDERAINAVAAMNGSLEQMHGAIAGALTVDDKIVATEVGFVQDGTYLSYIGAFDWQMRDFSVGKLQIEDALKWSFENGIKTYDFLGEPSTYKSDWSNDEVALYCCHHGQSIKGWLYADLWMKKLRPRVKKSFVSLPVPVRKMIMAMVGK